MGKTKGRRKFDDGRIEKLYRKDKGIGTLYYIFLHHENFTKYGYNKYNRLSDTGPTYYSKLINGINNQAIRDFDTKFFKGVEILGNIDKAELFNKNFLKQLDKQIMNYLNSENGLDKVTREEIAEKRKNFDLQGVLNKYVESEDLKDASKIFEYLYELANKLDENLAAILINAKNKYSEGNQVSDDLKKALEKWKNEIEKGNKKTVFKGNDLDGVIKQIYRISKNIEDIKAFKKNNKNLAGAISHQINQNLIPKIFQEIAPFAISKLVEKGCAEFEHTGANQVTPKSGRKITGKMDASLKFLKFLLEYQEKEYTAEISLGFNIKDYKTLNDASVSDTGYFSKDMVKSGSGGTLKQAIQQISSHENVRQYIYNVFAFSGQNGVGKDNADVKQVNDLLLRATFLRCWSYAGKEELNNYMLINGELFSIRQMLYFISKKEIGGFGSSRSIFKDDKDNVNGTGQALYLSIPGRKKIKNERMPVDMNNKKRKTFPKDENADDMITAWERSRKLNKDINALKITQYIHVEELRNAMYGANKIRY